MCACVLVFFFLSILCRVLCSRSCSVPFFFGKRFGVCVCVCFFLVERVISFFFLDVTRCTVSRASLARPRAKKTGDTPPSHAGVTAVLQGLLLQLTAIGITASGGSRGRRPSFVRRGNSNPQKSAVSAHSGRHHG